MSVEVLPFGVRCNIACTYCYQAPMRAGETKPPYDMEKMKATLVSETEFQKDKGFQVFGGEPLLLPLEDLDQLLSLSFSRSGRSGVQTNATLITEAHFEIFQKYKTHVGVSMDGPEELNDTRWAGSLERTREATAKSQWALEQMLARKIGCSLIITLTKVNATAEKLPRLTEWLKALTDLGMQDARMHVLEVDSPKAAELRLSDEDAAAALLHFHRMEPFLGIRLDVFKDMLSLLRGQDEGATCIWNGCDPATTGAVRGVGPSGERLNCGRTNKDDRNWLKADVPSFRRQLLLYSTPYEDGGCAGCRFFVACKGQCPGEAINGDFRNRSSNCRIWFQIFEVLEAHLMAVRDVPVSLRPDLKLIEQAMLSEWRRGRQPSVKRGIELARTGSKDCHGDFLPDDCHGDAPHGDSHGDHTDATEPTR